MSLRVTFSSKFAQFANLLIFLITFFSIGVAHAQNYRVVYAFAGGADGSFPYATLFESPGGNLYGTTIYGGGDGCDGVGCGTVFAISPTGSETVLHSFLGSKAIPKDGAWPYAGLISDVTGNLYGTTYFGGNGRCANEDIHIRGCGTIFQLASDGNETILHIFRGGRDGSGPYGSLIMDKNGNLFGLTSGGNCLKNCGTAFELAPDGTFTVLHRFEQAKRGAYPVGSLVVDNDGNLFGATEFGGGKGCTEFGGCGTIFKITPAGKTTVLHAFNGKDGAEIVGSLVLDSTGNLLGATNAGGLGCGTVYKMSPKGKETILYAFKGGSDGCYPENGLVEDANGNLYGTTANGGDTNCPVGSAGCGIVYEIASNGAERILHAFEGGSDGEIPWAGLTVDASGNLYGATEAGGSDCNCGVVFELSN